MSGKIKQLVREAAALKVNVKFKPYWISGQFFSVKRMIVIDNSKPNNIKLYALAHELGHAKYDDHYDDLWLHKTRDKEVIFSTELRAWEHAEVLAKKYKFYNKSFVNFKNVCILHYKALLFG